jgi:FeS assembly protein IscX
MKWVDSRDIAIALAESTGRRSGDRALHRSAPLVIALPSSTTTPALGRKMLEAIRMLWIEETEE